MKKLVASFFVLSFLLLFSENPAFSEQFIISGNPNAPPVVWKENNSIVGFAPDFASSIFNILDIEHTVRYIGNWQEVQDNARQGNLDMILSAYRNKDRETYLEFSNPYLFQPTVIIVKKGNEFKLSSWDSLVGKMGISNIGESYGEEFDQFIKNKLSVSYFPLERAIQLLARDEADYLIADLYTALIYAMLLQGEDAISVLDPPVTIQPFHFAVAKNSELTAYLPEINKKIDDKVKNGEVQNLLLMHFDNWKQRINQKNSFLVSKQERQTQQQRDYVLKQEQMARQRLIGTMENREGLPKSAQ